MGEAEMAALPLTRHPFHGDWNYVLHPQPAPSVPAARTPQPPTPAWDRALLSDPALTGLSPHQLDDLTQTLAPDGDPGRGRPPRLAFHDQVLATVLHLHVNGYTVLYDPEGRIDAELPLDGTTHERVARAVLAWSGPDALRPDDYEQVGVLPGEDGGDEGLVRGRGPGGVRLRSGRRDRGARRGCCS